MGKSERCLKGLTLIITLLAMNACLKNDVSPEAAKSGSISIALKVSGSSTQFKSLARAASVRISAPDMEEMMHPLSLTDSSVQGTVEDVPAGPSRKFEIGIFDSLQKEIYYGSAIANVKADTTNAISMVVKRLAGSVVVEGSIVESPDSATLSQRSLRAGAQSSASYGSFLDIDAFSTYLPADGKANAAEIDLIFAYSASIRASAIYSPYAAKNGINGGAGYAFLSGFAPAIETELRQVPVSDLSQINYRSQLDSLWNLGSIVTNGRLAISTGLSFMAKSNRGKLVLMQTVSVTSDVTGDCELVGKAEF